MNAVDAHDRTLRDGTDSKLASLRSARLSVTENLYRVCRPAIPAHINTFASGPFLSVVALAILAVSWPLTAADTPPRPNVLCILCDDLRPDWIKQRLATDPAHAATRKELEQQLAELLASSGLTLGKDTMPLDEGIKAELPDQKIR